MSGLTSKEIAKRTKEVKEKGVYFYTASEGNAPLDQEEAEELITKNMDAIIGNKKLYTPQETRDFLRGLFSK